MKPFSLRRAVARQVWSSRTARWSVVWLGALSVLALAAPALEALFHVDGTRVDLSQVLLPPFTGAHVLGTDELGRDVFCRLLWGARISLSVAAVTALCATALGCVVGVVAGLRGGWVDAVLMRTVDLMLSVPVLPLLMLASALPLPETLQRLAQDHPWLAVAQVAGLMALLGWMGVARLARAVTLQLRHTGYVEVARVMGAGTWHVLREHLLPGVLGAVSVAATLEVGTVILYEAALSFLGLGVRPPLASWGNMLTHAQDHVHRAPLLALWPGLCIFLCVVAVNILGDALRDAMDPARLSA